MSAGNGTDPALRGRRILITGGAGFVGTNLSHHFASRGADIVVYDDLTRKGVERNVAWLKDQHGDRVSVRIADVRDEKALGRAVEGADSVFHLAAQVAVTTSVRDPLDDFTINARGTFNVLEAVRRQPKPPGLIFTSTNKVYGGLDDVTLEEGERRYEPASAKHAAGIRESHPLDFHSPYGCSKGAADQYVLDYARVFGIPATVFRMSCIYGPHQHGNEDQGWVAHFLIRALRGETITLFGDGKQVRDILYVGDLVRAFEAALRDIDEVAGQAFNVGGGATNSTSLLELLDLVGELDGRTVDLEFGDWRPGDQRWYVSDTARLRALVGWEPKVGIREGVGRLYEWLHERHGRGEPAAAPLARAAAV